MHRPYRSLLAVAAASGLCLAGGMAAAAPAFGASAAHQSASTTTPIKHLVVIGWRTSRSTTTSGPIPTPPTRTVRRSSRRS